jgi:hypothetical protein
MIVGSTICSVLRAPRETMAIAVSEAGARIAEMIKITPRWSILNLRSLDDYRPTMFSKPAEEIAPY